MTLPLAQAAVDDIRRAHRDLRRLASALGTAGLAAASTLLLRRRMTRR